MGTRINLFDTKQEENISFAIITRKLEKAGLFRIENQCDYGIDADLEIADSKGFSTARRLKLQIKSSQLNHRRSNGHITFGGIKQTTLEYWAETSRRILLVGIFVDLETEEIYVSEPLFWQSTQLIDGKDIAEDDNNSHKRTVDFGSCSNIDKNIAKLKRISELCAIDEFVVSHKWILSKLYDIMSMYENSSGSDPFMESEDSGLFSEFLFHFGKLYDWYCEMQTESNRLNKRYFETEAYQSNYDMLTYSNIYGALSSLFPKLKNVLDYFRQDILNGGYYWIDRDPMYLKLVFKNTLPEDISFDAICSIVYKGKRETSDNKFLAWLTEQDDKYKGARSFTTKYNSYYLG